MALVTKTLVNNLHGHSFLDEFNKREKEYLGLANLLATTVKDTLVKQGIWVFKSEEEFAEYFLVNPIGVALLSSYFPYFRQALQRRMYISSSFHHIWSRSMARYVLHKAIEKGALL